MRLVTFSTDHGTHLGALVAGQVIDLPGTYAAWQRTHVRSSALFSDSQSFPTSMLHFLQADEATREVVDHVLAFAADPDLAFPVDHVTFLPPIPRPGKIVCLGHNYRRHIAEMGSPLPQYPVLFARFATTLIGHRQPIVLPKVSNQVDYEAELALVIGRTGKDIPKTQCRARTSTARDPLARRWSPLMKFATPTPSTSPCGSMVR